MDPSYLDNTPWWLHQARDLGLNLRVGRHRRRMTHHHPKHAHHLHVQERRQHNYNVRTGTPDFWKESPRLKTVRFSHEDTMEFDQTRPVSEISRKPTPDLGWEDESQGLNTPGFAMEPEREQVDQPTLIIGEPQIADSNDEKEWYPIEIKDYHHVYRGWNWPCELCGESNHHSHIVKNKLNKELKSWDIVARQYSDATEAILNERSKYCKNREEQ